MSIPQDANDRQPMAAVPTINWQASDPPTPPPGQPQLPDPDAPVPVEEPPAPIPIPRDLPPEPLHA